MRCDQDIYDNGVLVAIVADRDSDAIEWLVITIRELTGISKIDWYSCAGRGCVKAIGSRAELQIIRQHFRGYQNNWLKVIE